MRNAVLLFVMLLALVPAAAGATGSRGPSERTTTAVRLDPRLPVDPYLQYGAQVEPGRRVRILVQKRQPSDSSRGIASAARETERDARERRESVKREVEACRRAAASTSDRDDRERQAAGCERRAANNLPDDTVREEMPFVKTLAMEVPLRKVLTLARDPRVQRISYDGPVRAESIDASRLKTTYLDAMAIPSVWNGNQSATGNSIGIAVLDSGVNMRHPDFGSGNLTDLVVNARATSKGDEQGHGSHVIGIIKSKDPQGRYLGVAPDAKVFSLKIADDTGMSTEADLLRGLQWVYDNNGSYGIRIVNLSVSGSVPTSYVTSPLAAAVEQLWLSGVVVVAAAGNRGSAADASWYAPGNDPFVITVGALDHNQTVAAGDDQLASFSSRGLSQDGIYKPDILAPGRQIVAPLASPTSTIGRLFAGRITDSQYVRLSGTSMAAPVVSGAIALLLERNPKLTPNQVKWLLQTTANAYPGKADAAGVLDITEAMQLAASGPIGVANQGLKLNAGIDGLTGRVRWGTSYWDTSYWDTSYWDTSYWDTSYLVFPGD